MENGKSQLRTQWTRIIFATFPLEDSAVETSGSYEKYVTFNGKRYSHIIDTRTGYPATGVISVSLC
jgi:thiamine biosynthesis lipoprotein